MNGDELLPSWSQDAAETVILELVDSITGPGPSYVPSGQRIATFDNDGAALFLAPLRDQLKEDS
jgi:hypothetical protein